jgi:hypothetical protein
MTAPAGKQFDEAVPKTPINLSPPVLRRFLLELTEAS